MFSVNETDVISAIKTCMAAQERSASLSKDATILGDMLCRLIHYRVHELNDVTDAEFAIFNIWLSSSASVSSFCGSSIS